MLKVLIVKMSSLGDVIHTLPAVTDAAKACPGIRFDWVVEPAFQEIPQWHPAVNRVYAVPVRYWRKNILSTLAKGELKHFISDIRQEKYDLVIDAQGLLKSALVSMITKGPLTGLAKQSAREPIASWFYQSKIILSKKQHAVEKVRQLFAQALGYTYDPGDLNYGIDKARLQPFPIAGEYVVFLHGTTWATKHWPEYYWRQLAEIHSAHGIKVLLPWGNAAEKLRAEQIQAHCQNKGFSIVPEVLPALNLSQIALVIGNAMGVVAVDTGLGHISAMMNVPTVSVYGPTYPGFTGSYGQNQSHMSVSTDCHPCFAKQCPIAKQGDQVYPPCFASLPAEKVWQVFKQQIITPRMLAVNAYG
tara:strand:+ start:8241 stop:9317 length:1077 start_codon:yes stop_codon:yes gene_type:complete